LFEIPSLLARFEPGEVFPFFLGVIVLATPLIFILTKHQQRMATIFQGRKDQGQPSEQEMRVLHELATLRQMVAQQTIALDDLRRNQRQLAAHSEDDSLRESLRDR